MLTSFLIKIIVLLLPTQLGLHLWPNFSRVAGIKIDYLSPTVYLLDILLLVIIILNAKKLYSFIYKYWKHVVVALIFIFFNTLYSVSPSNAIFWWTRTSVYILSFIVFYIKKIRWDDIRKPLLLGTFTILFLEILQTTHQSSVGGIFYYLGERHYSASTVGIGRYNILGQEYIRPTSTFSHSNSLAGYLLIVFYLFSKKTSQLWHRLIPFIGILLTLSKTSIVSLAVIIFNIKPEITIFISMVLSVIQPMIQNISFNMNTVSERLSFFKYQKIIMSTNPLTGVGLGGYIPTLGRYLPGSFLTQSKLQPIHNIFYLALSEVGVVGVAITYLMFIKKWIYK